MRIIEQKRHYFRWFLILATAGFCGWFGVGHLRQYLAHKPPLFTVKNISWTISNLSGSDVSATMIPFLENELMGKNILHIDGKKIKEQLHASSDRLQSVSWDFDAERNVHVTLQGFKPLFLVNDQFVLSDNRALLPVELFEDDEVAALPCVQVDPALTRCPLVVSAGRPFDTQVLGERNHSGRAAGVSNHAGNVRTLSERVVAFLNSLPKDFFTNYAIFYKNFDYIELTPKNPICFVEEQKEPKPYSYCLVCDKNSIFDKGKLESVSGVFKDLEQKSIIKAYLLKRQKGPFIFDVRFKDQVVVKLPDAFSRGRGS